jgi:hypothetical protein
MITGTTVYTSSSCVTREQIDPLLSGQATMLLPHSERVKTRHFNGRQNQAPCQQKDLDREYNSKI